MWWASGYFPFSQVSLAISRHHTSSSYALTPITYLISVSPAGLGRFAALLSAPLPAPPLPPPFAIFRRFRPGDVVARPISARKHRPSADFHHIPSFPRRCPKVLSLPPPLPSIRHYVEVAISMRSSHLAMAPVRVVLKPSRCLGLRCSLRRSPVVHNRPWPLLKCWG